MTRKNSGSERGCVCFGEPGLFAQNRGDRRRARGVVNLRRPAAQVSSARRGDERASQKIWSENTDSFNACRAWAGSKFNERTAQKASSLSTDGTRRKRACCCLSHFKGMSPNFSFSSSPSPSSASASPSYEKRDTSSSPCFYL